MTELPEGSAQRNTNPPSAEPGASSLHAGSRFRIAADAATWLTVGGVLLYVALRVPFDTFYGLLGTSVDEVGLDYTKLLTQSVALMFVIALVLVVVYGMMFPFILLHTSHPRNLNRFRSDRGSYPVMNRDELARMSPEDFQIRLQDAESMWKASGVPKEIIERDIARRQRLRELDTTRSLTRDDRRERRRLAMSLTFSGDPALRRKQLGLMRRQVPWGALGITLMWLVVVYPPLAYQAANDVKDCHVGFLAIGHDLVRPAELLDSQTLSPLFQNRLLFLLGRDADRYVLFDCKQHSVLRVPASTSVVITYR